MYKISHHIRIVFCLMITQKTISDIFTLPWLDENTINAMLVHKCKGKARTGQELGVREDEDSRFQENRHTKVVRLSALRTGRL
jgi:hypothetical protein